MRNITILATVALNANGTSLHVSPTGDIKAFAFDDFPDITFAMVSGSEDKLVLSVLTGSIDQGYMLIGFGDIMGSDIMFFEAELEGGVVVDYSDLDFVTSDNGIVPTLPLAETLALIATSGLGDVRQVNLVTGDTTMFEVTDRDGTGLTVFDFDNNTYGVYINPDKTHVVMLDMVDDSHLRAKRIVGTFQTAELSAAIVSECVTEMA